MSAGTTLLRQWKLLTYVIDSDWATRLDIRIARIVIDRHYEDTGGAKVALRFIQTALNVDDRRNIIDSLRRLTANGIFSKVIPGSGKRPTFYVLNFALGASRGGPPNTSTIGGPETTSEVAPWTPLEASRGGPPNTESDLIPGLLAGVFEEDRIDPPDVAAPPPTPAVAGPTVPSAFEELWGRWSRKTRIAAARAAFANVPATSHQAVIAAAERWTVAYDAETPPRDERYRKHLANWLSEERWREDGPEPPFAARTVKPLPRARPLHAIAETLAAPPLPAASNDNDNGDDDMDPDERAAFEGWIAEQLAK